MNKNTIRRMVNSVCVVMILVGVVIKAEAGIIELPRITDTTPLRGKSVFENMDVPAVRERNPDPSAGPRIWVKQIKVQGIIDRPEYGILKSEIDVYVEELRKQAMREAELLKYGYSLQDLSEIGNLMLEIDAANNIEQVTEPDVQRLVWLVKDQKERRGLTLGQIEEIATGVSNYYRERGFFLTKVYIPKQEVRDGVVGLTILEGKLGDVKVQGNERYGEEFLSSSFKELMYQPVNSLDIEQKLYLLNDYPGLNVYGYFKAGEQIGDTRLTLEVRDEDNWSAVSRLDNHGSDITGENRFFTQFDWHNPTGYADNLVFGFLQTFNPTNATYGFFRYRIPVYKEFVHAGISYTENQFVISNTGTGNVLDGGTGETAISNADIQYSLIRRRNITWQTSLGVFSKDTEVKQKDVDTAFNGADIEGYTWSMSFDRLNEASRTLHQFSGEISNADYDTKNNSGDTGSDSFTKLNLKYSFLTFAKVPWTNSNSRIVINSGLQYTDDWVPSVEQITLSGANFVRAFSVSEASAHRGLYVSADWVFEMPDFADFNITRNLKFSKVAQPFLFIDYGYGKLLSNVDENSNEAEEAKLELMGIGFGLQAKFKNSMAANLQFAFPIRNKYESDSNSEGENTPGSDNAPTNLKDENQIIFDIQYAF